MNFKDLVLTDQQGNRYGLILLKDDPQTLSATSVPSLTNSTEAYLDFRSKLRKLRGEEQITQTQLAIASGIKQSNIAAIENGTRAAREATKKKIILGWEKITNKKWKN